ncbi:MAG TPA: MBOAT family O-acyltransferase [Pirellulales bacterium]|nr:MBOAT family O-acyltransferase [Pirellulales bacterium]
MTEHYIDLAKPLFWIVCGVGFLLLTPVTSARPRQWVWCGVNVLFLALLLPPALVGGILVAVVAVYLLLVLVQRQKWKTIAAALLAGSTLALFLIHKLPQFSGVIGLGGLASLLTLLGFSYTALRTIDVLRAVDAKRAPAPDLISTFNYLLPFHMLAAGPIQSYEDFARASAVPQPLSRENALVAMEWISRGLMKKFVLAYILQKIFLTDFRAGIAYSMFEAQVFAIWLFLDFSGYSDIAVGVGTLLGIATPLNFNRPYLARNMIDYWERWHITLSQFIRRNVFIPIQLWLMRITDGDRPLLTASLALSASFILCGLWHSISVRFLVWGILHATGLVTVYLYQHFLRRKLGARGLKQYLEDKRIRVLSTILTFEYVAFSLVVMLYPVQ